jgi:hypothetical protein
MSHATHATTASMAQPSAHALGLVQGAALGVTLSGACTLALLGAWVEALAEAGLMALALDAVLHGPTGQGATLAQPRPQDAPGEAFGPAEVSTVDLGPQGP